MSEWQPIETAPKNVAILVYPSTWGDMIASPAKWDDDKYNRKPKPYWSRRDSRRVSESRDNPPTHWMPLPEPPK